MLPWDGFCVVQVALQGGSKNARNQRGFSGAGHAGHRGQEPKRNVDVDALQVVVRGPLDAQAVAALCFRPLLRNLDASPTGEVVAGHRPFRGHDLLGWTVGHDGPTLKASSWAEVAQPIGLTERVFVVFDHHEGVAEVGQFPQGFEQALVVALMQSNGRFVKHVHHARET